MAMSLSAVAVGIYSALNVSGLTALVGSRIYDRPPRNVAYPCVVYSLDKSQARGFGTRELAEVTLRVSVLSKSETQAEGQAIAKKVEDLLSDAALTVSGHQLAGKVTWRETVELGLTEWNGVPTQEWVCQFTLWAEPQ